jgi:hypothetical protein
VGCRWWGADVDLFQHVLVSAPHHPPRTPTPHHYNRYERAAAVRTSSRFQALSFFFPVVAAFLLCALYVFVCVRARMCVCVRARACVCVLPCLCCGEQLLSTTPYYISLLSQRVPPSAPLSKPLSLSSLGLPTLQRPRTRGQAHALKRLCTRTCTQAVQRRQRAAKGYTHEYDVSEGR